MKPYYETKLGKLYHSDCLEIISGLEPVDLVLTDSPYGIGWNTNYSRFSRGTSDKRPIQNDDLSFDPTPFLIFPQVILWGWNHYANILPTGSLLIWDKRNKDGTAFLADGEAAWWNKGRGVYIKSISGQRHRSISGGFHPTQKPIELMLWCIDKTKTIGTILDPFLGSGTTAIACECLNRKWIGIEISEKYCEIAAKRIERERKLNKCKFSNRLQNTKINTKKQNLVGFGLLKNDKK